MGGTIVAMMAHADDIEYYAGATFAKHGAEGYRLLYGVLSRCNSGWTKTAERGGFYTASADIVPRRKAEAQAAAAVYGATLYQGDWLENCYTRRDGSRIVPTFTGALTLDGEAVPLDADTPRGTPLGVAAGAGASWRDNRYVRAVADLLVEWKPDLVIGQEITNFNPDHFAAAQIVAAAWLQASERASIGPYWIPVSYAGPEAMPFPPLEPTQIIDVTGHEAKCLQAMRCHVSQGGQLPDTEAYLHTNWSHWGKRRGVASGEAFYQVYRS